jgi:hypothetical protein
VTVPAGLHVSFAGALILTAAHAVATFTAGAFGFVAVLGLREVTSAIVGQDRFQRISAMLQAALVVMLVSSLLLLPAANGNVARNWMAQRDLTARALPPLWFVGLNETLAGSVIDALPRSRPERLGRYARSLVVADRNATNLYRSLWPRYHDLALTAIAALLVAFLVTIAACVWNSRRLPVGVIRRSHERGPTDRARTWIVTHAVARTPLQQAGFFFTLQTLPRQVAQRVAMASSLAVALSVMLIAARGRVMMLQNETASVPIAVLAGQSFVLASVLGGFRHAVRLPAELRASSTFGLAWGGNARPYLSGVKRAGWMAIVVPTILVLAMWYAAILGPRVAALHVGVGIALSSLLMEILFCRTRRVALVSSYLPDPEANSRRAVLLVTLAAVSLALAWVERFALSSTTGYMALLAALVAGSVGIRLADNPTLEPPITFDADEQASLPTQRLNLAS